MVAPVGRMTVAMDWVELFKLVGSAAGLGIAGFTFYDRAIRSRPTLNLTASVPEALGIAPQVFVSIKNNGSVDIIIEEFQISDEDLVVSKDENSKSFFQSLVGLKFVATINAGEERKFPIFDNRSENSHKETATITVKWRPVTAYWLGRVPKKLRIRSGIIESMKEDARGRLEAIRAMNR